MSDAEVDAVMNRVHTEQARYILDRKTDAELMDFAGRVIEEFLHDPYNRELAVVLKERGAKRQRGHR